MRKTLICAVIALLVILAFIIIFKGVAIGNFKILSTKQISEENKKLTEEISQTELLMKNVYQSKVAELETSVTSLLKAKQDYMDLANISTAGEINDANQVEEYTIEYLFTKLGNYATNQGVAIAMNLPQANDDNDEIRNISFTVNGPYASIINFIEALEDDSVFAFKINSFKIDQGSENLRKATFIVNNIRVKTETKNEEEVNTQDNQTEENNANNNTSDNTVNGTTNSTEGETTQNIQQNEVSNQNTQNEGSNQTTQNQEMNSNTQNENTNNNTEQNSKPTNSQQDDDDNPIKVVE